MTQRTPDRKKDDRIVVRCDAAFLARVDRVAKRAFADNRSYMTRKALEELLARYEGDAEETAA